MEVHLTPDQEVFVRQGIAAGRYQNEADAIAEALALWEERERRRTEILAAVDAAEASLARGEGRVYTEETLHELAEGVKRRGRARLEAERAARR
jgi:putative addiction module CopG family antidote